MRILAVDTALGACSAAVLKEEQVYRRFVPMARGHAEALAPMVADVMAEAGLDYADLDRLAVTTGPGTFTGQRIGLAFMRALKVATGKPLNGVTSLAAMAAQALAETDAENQAKTCAVLHDARRDEVYFLLAGACQSEPEVLGFGAAVERLKSLPGLVLPGLVLAGTAAPAAAALLPQAVLSPVTAPDALWVARLAADSPPAAEAPAPLYLRPPDAKLPGGLLPDAARPA
ncbi:MAG: tRNA (adenosine(37)-N6)-threonylcarbamoyltransferase complex dimerization subunit type 1 TsaB [Rhizomicrobium sp.]